MFGNFYFPRVLLAQGASVNHSCVPSSQSEWGTRGALWVASPSPTFCLHPTRKMVSEQWDHHLTPVRTLSFFSPPEQTCKTITHSQQWSPFSRKKGETRATSPYTSFVRTTNNENASSFSAGRNGEIGEGGRSGELAGEKERGKKSSSRLRTVRNENKSRGD